MKGRLMQKYVAAILLLSATPSWAAFQPEAAAPLPKSSNANGELDTRANEIMSLINGGEDPANMFHPDFLAAIPEAQLRALAAQITASFGTATRVIRLERQNANAGTATVALTNGSVRVQFSIEPTAPRRITSLRINDVISSERSLTDVMDSIKALPGRTNFALYDLNSGVPILSNGYGTGAAMPVGSAFKLIILAELVRAIEAGERQWEDTIPRGDRDLPPGLFSQSPSKTQLSLYTLAEKMISVSDNSATDLLLHALGRERVESVQLQLGIEAPGLNRPFIGTLDAFKLKSITSLRERWIRTDEQSRRQLLTEIESAPSNGIAAFFQSGKPASPDLIEWFLTPLDLARTMEWLRRHTQTGPAAKARDILALNSGVRKEVALRYKYVGYKGGSEPGLIHMTFLLQDQRSNWKVLTASWLDKQKPIDEYRFATLMARASELALDIE